MIGCGSGCCLRKLIHSANPKSRLVGIIALAHVVRPSFPTFQYKKAKQQKKMFAPGVTVGLAEWIIDDAYLRKSASNFFKLGNQIDQNQTRVKIINKL